jgi:AcrR family transcriptional regulator
MSEDRKRQRRYDSPRRRQQAAATRDQIMKTAQRLFEHDGYAATSVAAIAVEAGVSLKTVYVVFGTKSGLLRALWHRLLRGDNEDIPVGEQPWFRGVIDEPDPRKQLRLNARNSREVKQRAGVLMEVIQGAAPADEEIGQLWSRIQTEFHANQRAVVASLREKGALRDGIDVDAATDILWTLNHPSLYHLLVGQRGWSPDRYEQWLDDLLSSQLLGDAHLR